MRGDEEWNIQVDEFVSMIPKIQKRLTMVIFKKSIIRSFELYMNIPSLMKSDDEKYRNVPVKFSHRA